MADRKVFSPNIIKLTPRGKEIFQLTLTGKTDTQIGKKLGISYNCVRRHKEKMVNTNNCNSMLELISKYYSALEHGDFYGK